MLSRTQVAALVMDVTGLPLPAFQQLLRQRAELALAWLIRSIEACGGEGSAVFYSRLYRPLRGWADAYPETTGYIIPTLIDCGKRFDREDLGTLAVLQARWVMSLQYVDGALPGGAVVRGRKGEPSIFNTGQMILGLVAAADLTGQPDFLISASSAARWLADELDETAGTWTTHAYVQGFSPAYYTRVCWPMLEVWKRTREERIRAKALRALDTILGWQQENGAFARWGFHPSRPAFTHTIAYTIRGFLESGELLGADGGRFTTAARRAALAVREQVDARGRTAGAYDANLAGRYWYTCLTGNCQLGIIWLRIARECQDLKCLRAALHSLWTVMVRQKTRRGLDPNTRGAVAGSKPFWGRYLFARYPNWAAKFFIDCCLDLSALLQDVSAAESREQQDRR
jgi:hypothetical protein